LKNQAVAVVAVVVSLVSHLSYLLSAARRTRVGLSPKCRLF